ncbi:uncharacterized protein E5676_scaffold96G00840 [Cucumis melo var. makuwa]|uniref:DUF4218 domain-containing protein n=1 Tax=Cucumis melo var. makuwa TaxID=1194695 RepID=A0A5A7SS49_CUCMM|nr:uncharacterized protein E6C27_scaffold134G00870 [Cucumis melo var. makuwa]TYK16815.1 uncharacterized protein E5676_scaffold96G00840 [Cucumis melo var. makuwa]
MSLLILDPGSPSREIDMYLQPLIEELKELWTFGVRTYDSLTGWSTKGYQACPICMGDRSSFKIQGRISFMEHNHYLLENHVWHRSRLHNGKVTGQVSYSSMYPIERSLHTSKQYARNKACPKGSIAEVYVMIESITFCLRYLSGIETQFTRDERNDDTIVKDKNKYIWDVPKVDGVKNENLNVLEIVVSHRVDEHIKDDTPYRTDVDPTIVERPIVRHVTDDFIDDVDEHLSHASTTSIPHTNFFETDAMFLEFADNLDNLAGWSSSVGNNSGSSSQPSTTPTPRRSVQS